jgi:hypothetical protein
VLFGAFISYVIDIFLTSKLRLFVKKLVIFSCCLLFHTFSPINQLIPGIMKLVDFLMAYFLESVFPLES